MMAVLSALLAESELWSLCRCSQNPPGKCWWHLVIGIVSFYELRAMLIQGCVAIRELETTKKGENTHTHIHSYMVSANMKFLC